MIEWLSLFLVVFSYSGGGGDKFASEVSLVTKAGGWDAFQSRLSEEDSLSFLSNIEQKKMQTQSCTQTYGGNKRNKKLKRDMKRKNKTTKTASGPPSSLCTWLYTRAALSWLTHAGWLKAVLRWRLRSFRRPQRGSGCG